MSNSPAIMPAMADLANGLTKRSRASRTPPLLTDSQANDLKRVSRYLPSAIAIFRRSYAGLSKAAAIKAKCLECSNLQKAEVRDCTISGCSLWQFRPYRRKEA